MNYSNKKVKKVLCAAAMAEEQAIAIYRAEMLWRPEKIFGEILAEELAHRGEIPVSLPAIYSFWNVVSGFVLGSFLSLVPRRLCYKLHVWAEKEAAQVYHDCYKALKELDLSDYPSNLRHRLKVAASQEEEHSARFAKHCGETKNIFPDAPFKSKNHL